MVYFVWAEERKTVIRLENRLSPKIGIAVHGDGVAKEEDESHAVTGKRVQVIVKSLTDFPLADCQVEIQRVERLDESRSTVILNEPLRAEWSNEHDNFGKITIPAGVEKQANLFFIQCIEGGVLRPIIPAPKPAFIESISRPGKYKLSILVSSISANAARAEFMLYWSDHENLRLEPV
jgi:hypothetical protein